MVSTEPSAGHIPKAEGVPDPRLRSVLGYWAKTAPKSDFLTFRDLEGRTFSWTYAGFVEAVRRLASELAANGLRAGERCVIHTGNSHGFMLAFWATQELGAVVVPTVAQYSVDELAFVIDDCDAAVVIASATLAQIASDAIGSSDCLLLIEGEIDSDGNLEILQGFGAESSRAGSGAAFKEDVALVLYTSGTTSRPKGVMLTHRSLLYTARTYAEHFRLQPRDRTLTCLPLFHVNGLLLQMLPVVLSGGQIVLTPRFSASQYWNWVNDYRISVAHLVAGPIRLLLWALKRKPVNSRVRLLSFGMPLTDDEMSGFESRFKIPLVMIWSSTETGCGGTIMPIDSERRPGHQNIGQAMRGWQVRLVDSETGREVPAGEMGEFRVKSPGVMRGYLGEPEATDLALQDGWVLTGDLGWRDEAGYFHFVDRLKDMLKPSGENVAASEVERVIIDHPRVQKCAVVGLPDPVRMEVVVAVVVPKPGAEPTETEIRQWCADRLAPFKVPSRIEFRTELPETSIGKVRKAELKQELLTAAGGDQ